MNTRNYKKPLIIAIAVVAVISIGIISHLYQRGKTEPVTKDAFYFDTTCSISVYDEELTEEEALEEIDQAFALCREYERILSRTKEGSDVWNINHGGGQPVKCDRRTIDCINKGLEYGRLSKGALDITVGRLVDLWDYHAETPKPPAEKELARALATVGYEKVKVDEEAGTVRVPEGCEVDLGAIAKGYIADRVAESMSNRGVKSALINFGGNIECIGDKGGQPFEIGIEKPYTDRTQILGTAPLKDQTITTSGVYERFFEYKGKKYHHILDTDTGQPTETDLLSVSVVGPEGTSADCDAIATICLIYGAEKGRELMEQLDGFEALFLKEEGEERITTDGFTFKDSP